MIEAGRWYHVTGSFDATTRSMRIYVDGELAGPLVPLSSQWPLHTGGGEVWVGCTPNFDHQWAGSLHDVRIWRGAVSEAQIASMMGNPPAELGGRWRLEGRGTDTSGHGHDMSFVGNTQFNDGWSCDPDGALELTGTGHAATAGRVVATDEAFTVSAWGRLDTLAEPVTFVSAAGSHNTAFRLEFNATHQRFQFIMTSGDQPSSSSGFQWKIARGGPAPEVDMWYHLVGVFDLAAGEIRLYVSGQRVATAAGPDSPWRANGPLLLGASGTIGGHRWNLLQGAVDDVVVWQGTVPDHIIGQISAAPVPKC
jgi:hypothetical protein